MRQENFMQKIIGFINNKKWFIIIGLIIIGIVWFSIAKKNANQVQYITSTVQRATITENVTEAGNIISDSQADVTPLANGIVKSVFVENGDFVYEGQPSVTTESLSAVDQQALASSSIANAEAAIRNAEDAKIALQAQMRSAKKTLADARVAYTTAVAGFKDPLITNPITGVAYTQHDVTSAKIALGAASKSYDAAVAKYNSADTSIAAANQSKTAAQASYDKTLGETVNAPISGTITNLNIKPNDKVSATIAPTGTASIPPMVIANMKKLSVKVPINEVDITKVTLDQTASITCDALKDKTFTAKITKIDSLGTSSQGVITYNVYLNLDKPDAALKPGMSANVNIEAVKHENVLAVSNSAVKPYQGGKAVQVLETTKVNGKDKQTPKYIPVKIGIRGIEKTEILEGLQEGQSFIISTKTTATSL